MRDPIDPDDAESFNDRLAVLLQRAADNGVEVEGGWKCTVDGNGHDHWDVQITGVEYDG